MANKEEKKPNALILQLESFRETGIQAYQKEGFERAAIIANATVGLERALTDNFMTPFMALMGKNYGFKADKTNYSVQQVRHCLIEAVMMGVQPVGNHFNIIAGNSYITREGFGYLLKELPSFSYRIVPEVPVRLSDDKATIEMRISWTHKGNEGKEKLKLPIKVNKFMGDDAIIGKATRKARKWLFETVTGSEVADGEINDIVDGDAQVISSKITGAQVDDEEDDAAVETPPTKQEQEVTIPEKKVTPPHKTTGSFDGDKDKKTPAMFRKKQENNPPTNGELFEKGSPEQDH